MFACREDAVRKHLISNHDLSVKVRLKEQSERSPYSIAIVPFPAPFQRWSRLSERNLRVDKWNVCRG
jgi:hypothetical protein